MNYHDDCSVMIQLFVDDELTGQERDDLLLHLNSCASCQKELKDAKAFSARVREAHSQAEAPAVLREKILMLANKPADHHLPHHLTKKTSVMQSYWRPLAAAVFCIAVGAFSVGPLRRDFRARSFVDAAVAEHRELGDNMQLDVKSDSPEAVSTWFAQRVSFPFRIPNEGMAADDRANYVLAGGRLVTFGGQPAALLEFRMPNNRISLLISSDKLAAVTGGSVTRSAGLSFHAKDIAGLHVASWNNKGLTYALISSVPMGSNRSCSTCHRDSPTASTAINTSSARFWRAHPLLEMSAAQVNHSLY